MNRQHQPMFIKALTGAFMLIATACGGEGDSDPAGGGTTMESLVSGPITLAEPTPGDQFGYYDTGLSEPSTANVRVPHTQGSSFDFQLGMIP